MLSSIIQFTSLKKISLERNVENFDYWIQISVGSNTNITKFELLRTSNSFEPRFSTKTELWTISNPSKEPELQTCSARNRVNPGTNLEKPNFEPFQIQFHLFKSNYKPTWTLKKSRTLNPRTGFDPTLIQIEPTSECLEISMSLLALMLLFTI